jgi:hypothetical protein
VTAIAHHVEYVELLLRLLGQYRKKPRHQLLTHSTILRLSRTVQQAGRRHQRQPAQGSTAARRSHFKELIIAVTAASRLTIVFAALAVSRWIEARTGWTIRKLVKTARRYREIKIQAGQHTSTAADPIPDDLPQALDAIDHPR